MCSQVAEVRSRVAGVEGAWDAPLCAMEGQIHGLGRELRASSRVADDAQELVSLLEGRVAEREAAATRIAEVPCSMLWLVRHCV